MRHLSFLVTALALATAGAGRADESQAQRQAWLGAPAFAAHPAEAVDIGALTLKSDFTVFLRPDCPEPLRRQALRKLWSLLPQEAQAEPTTF